MVPRHRSLLSTRTLASIRSDVALRRRLCCRHGFLIFEIGPYLLNQSTFGTATSFFGTHDHRYYKIFLHLHFGAIRLRLWLKSTLMVLCGIGEEQVLSFASRCCGFWWPGKSLYYLATIFEVSFTKSLLFHYLQYCFFSSQPFWDLTITLLGFLRLGRFGVLRFSWH